MNLVDEFEKQIQKDNVDEELAVATTSFYRSILGLQSWGVSASLDNDSKFGTVNYHFRGQVAKISYNPEQTVRSLEATTVHELLHVSLANLENVYNRVLDCIKDAKLRDTFYELLTDEQEAFIARTADAIVALRRGEYKDPTQFCTNLNTARGNFDLK